MTEEEAKQRWCPFARIADTVESGNGIALTSINRAQNGQGEGDCRCLASGCMAWRPDMTHNPNYNPMIGSFPAQQTEPMYIEMPGHGHCGLAH